MFITFVIVNSEECFDAKFDINWAYSWAGGSFTIGFV